MRDLRFLFKTRYGVSRALVIGIDRYKGAPPLTYAVSDATAIKDVLIADLGFQEADVALLIDEAATKDAIHRAFLRFASDDVGLDDRIVVFFAGHGSTRTGMRGEVGYLVPHDADSSDVSTFLRWDDLTRNADLIRAKHVLFIMDACYGGLALVRTASAGSTRFLKDMMLRPSRQVLTAGKADEVVSDSGGPIPDHSVFTGHLIEALQGKASTADGVLTASAVMAYVYAKVANDKHSRQTPHYGHIDGDGDMVLLAPGLDSEEESATKDLDRLISIPFPEPDIEINSITAKVARVKNLLSSETGAIVLHDVLSAEVRQFLSQTAEDSFPSHTNFSQDEFTSRLANYEAAVQDISTLLACVSQWGQPQHLATLQKCLARSSDRIERNGGLVVWRALRFYPLLIEMYCCGIAAIDAGRFDSLAVIFKTQLPTDEDYQSSSTFIEAAASSILDFNRADLFKRIPGHERHYAPLSEYFHKILQPRLDDTLFLGKNYESAFDAFEVFFSLCVADTYVDRERTIWAPVGRFGWKLRRDNSPLERVLNEAEKQKGEWAPIKAGLFRGDYARFEVLAAKYKEYISHLRWN